MHWYTLTCCVPRRHARPKAVSTERSSQRLPDSAQGQTILCFISIPLSNIATLSRSSGSLNAGVVNDSSNTSVFLSHRCRRLAVVRRVRSRQTTTAAVRVAVTASALHDVSHCGTPAFHASTDRLRGSFIEKERTLLETARTRSSDRTVFMYRRLSVWHSLSRWDPL